MNRTITHGPVGYSHVESAPRDGTFIRLRFAPTICDAEWDEVEGQWQPHEEMRTGGSWFDRDGYYISPGPLFWKSIEQRRLG